MRIFLSATTVLVFIFGVAFSLTAGEIHVVEILSPTHVVDREYRSMQGPGHDQKVSLIESPRKELTWITGYEALLVGEDGKTPMSQEFNCHSTLTFQDVKKHNELFGGNHRPQPRLFVLSQGQTGVRFPKGFGIPMMSDEQLNLFTQVLNLNPLEKPVQLKHKVNVEFVFDKELKEPLKPLFEWPVTASVLVEGRDGYYGVDQPDPNKHGPGCALGELAPNTGEASIFVDRQGRKFVGHWLVKPGRTENHSLITNWMQLPFDTTIHCIVVHLHPFGESLELRDLTTGQSLFKSEARNFRDKIGLEYVSFFSSEEGIPVYKGHEYELITVYNNTTSSNSDAMASMYLYLLDKGFKNPTQ